MALEPLLNDLQGKAPVEGVATVVMDVSTQGKTVGEFKGALAGTANFAIQDGAIRGVNVGKVLRETKSLFSAGQSKAAATDVTEKTDFSELSASFKLDKGVAKNDDLMMKAPLLRVSGAGDVDVGKNRINYLARVDVVNTATGQGGKELAHLHGLGVPIRLSGPLSAPDYKFEFGAVAKAEAEAKAQAKVKAKTDAVKQQAKDAVQNKLKGLFK